MYHVLLEYNRMITRRIVHFEILFMCDNRKENYDAWYDISICFALCTQWNESVVKYFDVQNNNVTKLVLVFLYFKINILLNSYFLPPNTIEQNIILELLLKYNIKRNQLIFLIWFVKLFSIIDTACLTTVNYAYV